MLLRALSVTVLTALSASVAAPTPASAQEPDSTQSTSDDDEGEPPLALIPFRRDFVGGHFQIGLTGLLAFPFGSASKDLGTRTRAGWGGGGAIDLTYGLDRYVALGAYAELNSLGDSGKCSDCSGRILSSGAFVRYHVSQGLRLDPWVTYGLGYMAFGSEEDNDVAHYAGIEWMRLQVGADWYVAPSLLIGPVVGLSAAHAVERPDGEDPGGPLMRATLGLRIAFDAPGRR